MLCMRKPWILSLALPNDPANTTGSNLKASVGMAPKPKAKRHKIKRSKKQYIGFKVVHVETYGVNWPLSAI